MSFFETQLKAPKSTFSIRQRLKVETDGLHRRLDEALSGYGLGSLSHYIEFLQIHALAIPELEHALLDIGFDAFCPNWSSGRRTDALYADLKSLGHHHVYQTAQLAHMPGAKAWGVAYVLEGSKLGSRILSKRVREEGCEISTANMRFLSHDGGCEWRDFQACLEIEVSTEDDFQLALSGAKLAFTLVLQAAVTHSCEILHRPRQTSHESR